MRFPIFASFIVFIIYFTIFSKRAEKKRRKSDLEFWEKEQRANLVRKRSLDCLDYIVIPYDTLPMDLETSDETVAQCIRELKELSGEKIVNFTGISNTDLKLAYGTANITPLSQYDQNYTIMVRILQNWAKRLYDLNHHSEALSILEFAIKTRTDVSASYYLAASIYAEEGRLDQIKRLILTAETLNSAMSGPIVRTLHKSYLDIDSPHSS